MQDESFQNDPERVCPECGGRKSLRAVRCHKCVQAERDRMSGRILDPHWKVRIGFRGGFLWLASEIEPVLHFGDDGKPSGIDAEWITEPHYGDTIAYLEWSEVVAVAWREYMPKS